MREWLNEPFDLQHSLSSNATTFLRVFFFSLVLRIQQDPVKAAGIPNTKLQNSNSDKDCLQTQQNEQ